VSQAQLVLDHRQERPQDDPDEVKFR
jgi:hypothetical protein